MVYTATQFPAGIESYAGKCYSYTFTCDRQNRSPTEMAVKKTEVLSHVCHDKQNGTCGATEKRCITNTDSNLNTGKLRYSFTNGTIELGICRPIDVEKKRGKMFYGAVTISLHATI